MSKQEAKVLTVQFKEHPTADNLAIVPIGGFQCVVNKNDWQEGTLAVHIEPDTIVKLERPEFSWLKDQRVKPRRFRGAWSFGLLIPAPEGAKEGDNLWDALELEHYEPELSFSTKSQAVAGPEKYNVTKYDIENGRKEEVRNDFKKGEPVYVTEKIHGCNVGCVFDGERLHVRSRNQWVAEGDNVFWNAINSVPEVIEFCKSNPWTMVYGEAYGQVKGFRYGLENGKVSFLAFDIRLANGEWLNPEMFMNQCVMYGVKFVPVLKCDSFDFDELCRLAEEPSAVDGKIREGVVVKPLVERRNATFNRVFLKIVNPAFLEKN